MNFHRDCACCGNRVTAYTLPLNEGLVRAFLKFSDARLRIGRPCKKGEIGLENSEYSNFQNLRHFYLIAQAEKGRSWEMTDIGWAFLRGEMHLMTPAAHLGGETLPSTHEAWATHHETRRAVRISDVMPEDWKQRNAFKAEKTGT
jgi:hypothetical protein